MQIYTQILIAILLGIKRNWQIFFGLIACILFLSSCQVSDSPQIDRKSDFLLGTLISVNIYDYGSADYSVVDECFDLIRDYEQIFSYNDPNSELSALNKAAFNNYVKVSDELFDIIFKSLSYCKKTNGAFDIGLGKLIEIWDKATILETPPDFKDISDEEINKWDMTYLPLILKSMDKNPDGCANLIVGSTNHNFFDYRKIPIAVIWF